jgi:hypothetical protein
VDARLGAVRHRGIVPASSTRLVSLLPAAPIRSTNRSSAFDTGWRSSSAPARNGTTPSSNGAGCSPSCSAPSCSCSSRRVAAFSTRRGKSASLPRSSPPDSW